MAASSQAATGTTVVSVTVPSATSIDVTGCAAGSTATEFGAVLPGAERIGAAPCVVEFGSSNDTATLRMAQDDGAGQAMSARTVGQLDTALGGGAGFAVTDVLGSDSLPSDQGGAVDAAGRFLFAGYRTFAEQRATVVRLSADGAVDTAFGGAGTGVVSVLPAGASASQGYAVLPLPDGRILLAGMAIMGAPTNNDLMVARLLEDGTPDPSFGGGDGIVVQSYSNSTDIGYSLTVDHLDRILVAGTAHASGDFDPLVARFLPDGSADTSFGEGGRFLDLDPGLQQQMWGGVDVDSAGRIVVGGTERDGTWDSTTSTAVDAIVLRLDSTGNLDASFDGDGRMLFSTSAGVSDRIGEVIVDDEDRILVSATTSSGSSRQATALRLRASDGAPDTTFGPGGRVDWDPGATTNDYAGSASQHDDGSYVIAGLASPDGAQLETMVAFIPESGGAPSDVRFVDVAPGVNEQGMGAGGADGRGGYVVLGYVNQGSGNDYTVVHFVGEALDDYGQTAAAAWSGSGSMFASCLEALASATSPAGYVGLDGDGSCGANDSDAWVPVPPVAAPVARTNVAGATATANLRFGMQVSANQAPGRYAARIAFTVVAPAT